jgi:glutamyl-tRNA reductase
MNLIALGINHNSAQVEMRERVAFAPEQVSEAMNDACNNVGIDEVVVLSTCNRTELYAVVPSGHTPSDKARQLVNWMADYHHLSPDELRSAAYHHEGEQALRHMVKSRRARFHGPRRAADLRPAQVRLFRGPRRGHRRQ